MAELSKNYNKIMSELEGRIKNPQDLEFVKNKFSELTVMFMDSLERLIESNEKQVKIERKVDNLEKILKKIEEDIYIDEDEEDDDETNQSNDKYEYSVEKIPDNNDEDYEFEIMCPYCNHEFITGKETNLRDEIECPNCHNIIELDWDDYCDGECDHCTNYCYNEEEQAKDEAKVSDVNENSEEYKYTKSNDENNTKNENIINKDNDNKNKENNGDENNTQNSNENEDDM